MTTRDFLVLLAHHPVPVALVLGGVPVATWLWSALHRREISSRAPWKYGYAVFSYLAVVPGTISLVILAYSIFFAHENLLDRDLLITLGPTLSMVATLAVIGRRLPFSLVPGFGRLSGFITLVALSFAAALAVDRTRLFVGFFGSIDRLFLLAAALHVVFQGAAWALFRRRR